MSRRWSPESIAKETNVSEIVSWLENATQDELAQFELAQLLVELSHRFRDLKDERLNRLTKSDSAEDPIGAVVKGASNSIGYEVDGAVGKKSSSYYPYATWKLYTVLWAKVLKPKEVSKITSGRRPDSDFNYLFENSESSSDPVDNNSAYFISSVWKKGRLKERPSEVRGDVLNSFWGFFNDWLKNNKLPGSKLGKDSCYELLSANRKKELDEVNSEARKSPIIILAYLCHTIGNIVPCPKHINTRKSSITSDDRADEYLKHLQCSKKRNETEKEWIKLFDSFNKFIKGNYFEVYKDLGYQYDKDFEKRLCQACACIIARGNRMRIALEEKCNNEEISQEDMALWFNDCRDQGRV